MLRFGRIGAPALIALALNGCAFALSALGSGAGTGAGMGFQHNVTGVVSKTYTASLPELRTATLMTLEEMSMPVGEDKQSDEGWLITAKARDRDISLRLQDLTPNTTRARVSVDNGTLFKDTATAEEILTQTSHALDEIAAVEIESQYEKMNLTAKKKVAKRPLERASTKSATAKHVPALPPMAKVSAARAPVVLPLPPPKPQQEATLEREHI